MWRFVWRFVLCSWVAASVFAARGAEARSVARDFDPDTVSVTVRVQTAEHGEALLRVVEGRTATVDFEEEGRKFGLVVFRQPAGDVAVQLSEIFETAGGEQATLLDSLVLPSPNRSTSNSQTTAILRRGQLFDVELVPDSKGLFRAKRADFGIEPLPGGDEQRPRECCITCNGVTFCSCGVETSCGSCCLGFCCNFF